MVRRRWPYVAFAALLAFTEESGLGGEEILAAVAGSPQPEATGRVRLFSSSVRDRLEVEVDRVDPVPVLTLFLDDGTGTLVDAGALPGPSTRRTLVFDTRRGDPLPAGAPSAADLAGRYLEIRDGNGAALLAGCIPVPRPLSHGAPSHGAVGAPLPSYASGQNALAGRRVGHRRAGEGVPDRSGDGRCRMDGAPPAL